MGPTNWSAAATAGPALPVGAAAQPASVPVATPRRFLGLTREGVRWPRPAGLACRDLDGGRRASFLPVGADEHRRQRLAARARSGHGEGIIGDVVIIAAYRHHKLLLPTAVLFETGKQRGPALAGGLRLACRSQRVLGRLQGHGMGVNRRPAERQHAVDQPGPIRRRPGTEQLVEIRVIWADVRPIGGQRRGGGEGQRHQPGQFMLGGDRPASASCKAAAADALATRNSVASSPPEATAPIARSPRSRSDSRPLPVPAANRNGSTPTAAVDPGPRTGWLPGPRAVP